MKFISFSLKLTQLSLGAVTVAISCLGIDNPIVQAAAASLINLQVSQNNFNFRDNPNPKKVNISKGGRKTSSFRSKFTDDFRGLRLHQPIPDFKFCRLISADVESFFDGSKGYDYTDAFIDSKGYRVTNTEPCYFNMALNGWKGWATGNASNFSNLVKEEEVWHLCNLPGIGGQKCIAVAVRNKMLIGLYDIGRHGGASWHELKSSLISKYGQPSGSDGGRCANQYGIATGSWESVWWWVNGSSLHYQSGCGLPGNYLIIKSKIIHDLGKRQEQDRQNRQRNNL